MNRSSVKSKPASSSITRFGDSVLKRAITAGPFVTLAISAALSGLFCYWAYQTFVSPNADDVKAAQAKLATLQSENNANEEIGRTKPQFLAEFRRALEKYDEARTLLPEEVEVSNVLAAVQQMAAQNGVRVTRFNSTTPGLKSAAADRLYERAVPTTVVGNHAAIARFMADVARYSRIIHLRDLAITSLKRNESADFTLVTFYSPPSLPPVPAELLAERQNAPPRRKEE